MNFFSRISQPLWLLVFSIAAVSIVTGCSPQAEGARPASGVATNPPQEIAGNQASQSHRITADQRTYKDISVGFTPEGYPYWGSVDAPVTLEEYSDFLCPFCGRHFNETLPTLTQKYLATGQVKYVFRDMPLVALHPNAPRGHAAARCVAEQGVALFWAFHDQLFKTQDQWRDLANPTDYLAGLAQGIGVDMTAYNQCLASGRMEPLVQKSVAAGAALGFNGTPSFQFIENKSGKTYTLVGAYPVATFTQWLDALVAGKAPPQDDQAQPQTAELPFWANAKGLAPDPKRPGFTMAGDPYKGNPQAQVVVIEFSNFQCPSCKKHALEAQPTIDKTLVDPGQVMWVFKNLPLQSLPQSSAAAVAAECAGDQGKFWEMDRALFEAQEQWAVDPPDPVLVDLAKHLNLDAARFSTCLGSRQALERVMNDLFDAQGAANTTPTFVVLYGGKASLLRGSLPPEQFVKTLQGALDAANAKPQSSQP